MDDQPERHLKPGSFYWAIPAYDGETNTENWINKAQPARLDHIDDNGVCYWQWLGHEGDYEDGSSDWAATWVGDEIVTPGLEGWANDGESS